MLLYTAALLLHVVIVVLLCQFTFLMVRTGKKIVRYRQTMVLVVGLWW
jgi:preprotein translocase subunit YajC